MDFSQVKAITIPEGSVNRILSGATVLWKKTGGLPTGYQQVEYIESDGSQYIDTGVNVSTNNKIIMDLQFTDATYQQINGGYYLYSVSGTSHTVRNDIGVASTGVFFMGASSTSITTDVTADTNRHMFMVDATTGEWAIDNTSGSVTPDSHSDYNVTLLIGARRGRNASGRILAPATYCEEKIYNVKIYNSGNLVRDFVPCYRKSDNVAGLYDAIGDVFYTNSGTGSFTMGQEVFPLPSGYQQVEYIESSGTQYIDTGVIGKTGLRIVAEMGYATPGPGLFGCRYGNTRFFVVLWPSPYFDFGYGDDIMTDIKSENRKIYNIDFDTSTRLKRFGIDGVYKTSDEYHDTPIPIYIFCYNKDGAATSFSKSIFKSMTITDENGGLLRKFVPCYRIADSEIGLYDLVSATFFTNSGSGTFIKGADVT